MTSSPSDRSPGQEPEARLRADAERNRDLILAAARRLFATEG
ncbi:MAG: TetR/AcrR family transcriptional regulator, partial [Streptomyces sp.]|nr:TetR/AcrR family transcriptional regulator [Streptomyces sp.]